MALKINITAQIANLKQLRRQIQDGLQQIRITAVEVSKTQTNASGKSGQKYTEEELALRRLNQTLNNYVTLNKASRMNDSNYYQAVRQEISALNLNRKALDDVIVGYAGIRRAYTQMQSVRKDEIKSLLLERQLRRGNTEGLTTADAKLKGIDPRVSVGVFKTITQEMANLNRQYNSTKDVETYKQKTQALMEALINEGFEVKNLTKYSSALSTAYKNLESIKSKANKPIKTDDASKLKNEKNAISSVESELAKLNKLYEQGAIKTREYINATGQLKASREGLSGVNQKVVAQTQALEKVAGFQLGVIKAREYKEILDKIKNSKETLLLLDKQTVSFMGNQNSTIEKYNKLSTYINNLNNAYKANNMEAEKYLNRTDRIMANTQRYAQLDAATQAKIASNRASATSTLLKDADQITRKYNEISIQVSKLNRDYELKNMTAEKYISEINKMTRQTQLYGQVDEQVQLKVIRLIRQARDEYMNSFKVTPRSTRNTSTQSQVLDLNKAFRLGKISATEYLDQTYKLINNSEKYAEVEAKAQMKVKRLREQAARDLIRQQMNQYNSMETTNKFTSSIGKYFSNMGMVVKKISDWFIGTAAVYGTINQIRKAVDYIIKMDEALTELNKVTNMTEQNLLKMKNTAIAMGKELGVSSVEIMKSMAEFGRVNKNPEEIAKLSKYAAMASKITTMTTQDAAKSFNTTMILYKKNVNDVGHILDSLNNIQNNFRTSAQDLTESIDKVGAAAQQTGVEMENLQGYTTAIVSATGLTGSEVGTAIKSFISRIYRIGEEGVGDPGKAMEALDKVGVKVMQLNGDFRDFDTVLAELSVKWKTMTTAEKQAVAQSVAGTYHYSKFISLMNNFDIAVKATNTALNSTGSSVNEYNKVIDSASGRLGKLTATIEDKFNKAIETDDLKNLISTITNVIKYFGDFNTIVMVVITTLLAFRGIAIQQTLYDIGAAMVGLATKTVTLKAAMISLKSSVNFLFILAAAITAVFVATNVNTNAQEDAAAARKENIDKLIKETETINNLKKVYAENRDLAKTDQMAKLKLLDAQEQLVNIYGTEASKLDLVNGKYDEQLKLIDKFDKKKVKENIKGIIDEINFLKNKDYGFPILEKVSFKDTGFETSLPNKMGLFDPRRLTRKFSEDYAIGEGYSLDKKVDLKENIDILSKMKDIINKSGDKALSNRDLIVGKESKKLLEEMNINYAVGLKTEEEKQVAEKAINDAITARIKDLEYINELELKAIEYMNNEVESKLNLNDTQRQIFEAAKASLDTEDLEKYQKEIYKLGQEISSVEFSSMKAEYDDINKKVANGEMSMKDYNARVEELRDSTARIGAGDIGEKLFRLTTDADPMLSTMEDLAKAEQDADKAYNKTVQNIDMLSDAYGKLLANQELDVEDKMKLLKAYPQLSSAINDNAKLLEMVSGLYDNQTDTIKENYDELLSTDSEFYKDALAGSRDYFDQLEDQYQLDYDTFYNFQQLKQLATQAAMQALEFDYAGNIDDDIANIKAKIDELQGSGLYSTSDQSIKQKFAMYEKAYALLLARKKIEDQKAASAENVVIQKQGKQFAAAAKYYEDAFNKTLDNVNELGEAMTTLSNGEDLSSESLMKLVKQYPQLSTVMNNEAALLEKITELHGTEAEAAKKKFELKLQYDTEYFQNLITLNENYFNGLRDAYEVDFKNFVNYAHAKASIVGESGDFLTSEYGADWQKDLNGTVSKLEARVAMIPESMRDQPGMPSDLTTALKQAKALQAINQQFQPVFDSVDFSKVGTDLTSKQKKDAKEAANNALIITERYRTLNAELEKTNNLLAKNAEAQKTATGQKLIDLLNEEVRLLNIKKGNLHAIAEEKRKERNEIVSELQRSGLGFNFVGEGDNISLTNSEAILGRLSADANKHRTDSDQDAYKALEEKYNKYNELVERLFQISITDIPDLQVQYATTVSDISENSLEAIEKTYEEIDKVITEKNKKIEQSNKELSSLTPDELKDNTRVFGLYNQEIQANSELISYLKSKIEELKNTKTDDARVQESINNKLIEYNDLLDEANYKNKELNNTLIEKQKAIVQDSISKYINYIKKVVDDYKESIQDMVKEEEKAFESFKEKQEDKIKDIEKEADAIKEVQEREEKLADIRKQQQIIDNLKAQKTAKVYKEGVGWVMTVDIGKLNEEQTKLKDMITDYDKWEADLKTEKDKKAIQDTIDTEEKKLKAVKDAADAQIETIEKAMKTLDDIVNKDNYIKSWNELMAGLKGIPPEFYQTEVTGLQGFFTTMNEAIKTNDVDFTPLRDKLYSVIPPELLDLLNGVMGTNISTGTNAGSNTNVDYSKMSKSDRIDLMKKNSSAWLTASDQDKKRLADENLKIGTTMGWTRSNAGYWYDKEGNLMYQAQGQADPNIDQLTNKSLVNPEKMSNPNDLVKVQSHIISQMKANSEAWLTASPEEKARLSKANDELVRMYNLPFVKKNGVWYDKGTGTRVYKQGGIADYTGFAWVDGSKTRPERILSSAQTESFDKLTKILPEISLDKNQSTKTHNEIYNIETIKVVTNDATDFVNNLKKIVYKRGV